MRSIPIVLVVAAAALATTSCKKSTFDTAGLACQESQCARGFVCNPLNDVCAVDIFAGCTDDCKPQTGQSCPEEHAFLDCNGSAALTCESGCRICEDGRWSKCRGCTLGQTATCADCDDDCANVILNATPACKGAPEYHCDYSGSCNSGFFDADGDRNNGCECTQRNNGADIPCNGIDEDCSGEDEQIVGDKANCSGCGDDCEALANVASATCTPLTHVCEIIDCEVAWLDTDELVETGCEDLCEVTEEVCDGIDNDCDGLIDTGDLDLVVDESCQAACGLDCGVQQWECASDRCEVVNCMNDRFDVNEDPGDGCECVVETEVCDNIDQDCDGTADNDVDNCACADGADPEPNELCEDDATGNGIDENCNGVIDEGCDCKSDAVVSVENASTNCNGGAADVVLMHLAITSACENSITRLRLAKHAASNTDDGDLVNVRLYRDGGALGLFDDDILIATTSLASGEIVFSGTPLLALQSGVPVNLIVVGDMGASPSYFAAEIGTDDITLSGANVQIDSPPLASGVHSLAPVICTDPPPEKMVATPPGTQGVAQVKSFATNSGTWASAKDPTERGSLERQDSNGLLTSDCSPDTSAEGDLKFWMIDAGSNNSTFMRIDTGLPLDLPFCHVRLRVIATVDKDATGQCVSHTLADFNKLLLYSYEDDGDVVNKLDFSLSGTDAPKSIADCADYVDVPITDEYATASDSSDFTDTFQLRLIAEAGNSTNNDDNKAIQAITELHVITSANSLP